MGGVPTAVTDSFSVSPSITDTLSVNRVMVGGTESVTTSLVAVPTALETAT